jgi:hypothetical protein
MNASTSVALLLDEVRPLVAEARKRGEDPRFVLLSPQDFEAVADIKRPELARNMPMMILGMEIVLSDDASQKPSVF